VLEDEEDEEEVVVGGRGDGAKREEARSRDDVRERERQEWERGRAGERKRGVDGAVDGRKAVGGGDGSVEQKGCGECGRGGTPMEENGDVASAG